MASSMLVAAAAATAAATQAAATTADDECQDELNSSLHSCSNDTEFAVICSFLQKFSKDLGIDLPNFKHLQEWLTNTDEVSVHLRDLHIKLLRKTRKTVHEKSWESALSKFCFTYSAQNAWEVERFGYKKSSLKVKLRIFRELLESQFERNGKFRAKILAFSADSLRSQPIGRDRLGHSYWLTQDEDCNLRIYQEHLDEEIWQVVATNRDEFVKLIARLRGNEVVLPSSDIGVVDEDTSSSNSCIAAAEKPPPPEEQEDDSQEEEARVPNLRIKLGNGNHGKMSSSTVVGKGEEERSDEISGKLKKEPGKVPGNEEQDIDNGEEDQDEEGEEEEEDDEDEEEEDAEDEEEDDEMESEDDDEISEQQITKTNSKQSQIKPNSKQEEAQRKIKLLLISQSKIAVNSPNPIRDARKRGLEDIDKSSPTEDINVLKKTRPSLLDSNRAKKPSRYEDVKSEEDDDDDDDEEEEGEEEEEDDDIDSAGGDIDSDIDSAAAEEDENEEKEMDGFDDDDNNDDEEVGEAIEDPPLIVRGEGSGKDSQGLNPTIARIKEEFSNDNFYGYGTEQSEVSAAIEEKIFYVFGNGEGEECLVGNTKNDVETSPQTPPSEPKATFFFGEPGCLKLSPIKQTPKMELNKEGEISVEKAEDSKEIVNENSEEVVEAEGQKESDKIENEMNEIGEEKKNDDGDGKVELKVEVKHQLVENENINTGKSALKNDDISKTNGDDMHLELIWTKESKNETVEKDNVTENRDILKADKVTQEPLEEMEVKSINTMRIEEKQLAYSNKSNNEIENVLNSKEIKILEETISNVNSNDSKEETNDLHRIEEQHLTEKALQGLTSTKQVEEVESDQIEDALQTKYQVEAQKTMTEVVAPIEEKPLDTPKPLITQSTCISIASDLTTIKTSSPTSTLPNRKRRLAEPVSSASCTRQSTTSESEIDLHSENQEDILASGELEEQDVGGKRFKMRPKLTNTEIRKKVEAQKVAVEETTSSSGEEEGTRPRKIISPKKQTDKVTVSAKRPKSPEIEAATVLAVEEIESEERKQDEKVLNKPKVFIMETQLKNDIPPAIRRMRTLHSAAATAAPIYTVKQKPTLAEIIEKKLKKTLEKPASLSLLASKDETEMGKDPELLVEAATTNTVIADTVAIKFIPPKKSPITKPLKKNLLTQIRQEESDEEAIPRKRTTSETVLVEPTKLTGNVTASTEKSKETTQFSLKKTPERKTPERQRKRRSSDEMKQSEITAPESKKDGVSEKLKKNNDEEIEEQKEEFIVDGVEEIKMEEITESKVELKQEPTLTASTTEIQQPMVGRRSGRRGGATVIYSELPQPKRTRGSSSKGIPKKEEIKEEKIESSNNESAEKKIAMETKKDFVEKQEEKITSSTETIASTPNATVKKDAKKSQESTTKNETPQAKTKADTIAENKLTPKKSAIAISKADSTPSVEKIVQNRSTGRKKREVDTTNIIEMTDAETPVRQSRRIAQQKIREEAERRKLEEIALRTMKQELKKKKKAEKEADPTVVEPSEHSSSSEEEEEEEAESEIETKKKSKKKLPGKDGWSSGSEEQDEPEEEDAPPHYETDPGSPLFKSDHEFSPESDLEDESQVVPMKRARTARKEDADDGGDVDGGDEEACQNCGKSDHPEWILLCDKCDKGYHCSCLSPVLFYIPEGDWFCPPCQQEQLIAALERQLNEFDDLVERKRLQQEENKRLAEEAERVEKERLEDEKNRKERKKRKHKHKRKGDEEGSASSDDNDDADEAAEKSGKDGENEFDSGEDENDDDKKTSAKKKSKSDEHDDNGKRRRRDGRSRRRVSTRRGTRVVRRRRCNESGSGSGSETDSGSKSGSSGSNSSSSATDSDDEPIYKLRKRRQINVSYRLNEYDDLINSALKKEMDEVAGAGNLGRGKDITTIIEADKEEKARQKQLENNGDAPIENEKLETAKGEVSTVAEAGGGGGENAEQKSSEESEGDDEPLKRKAKPKQSLKKKSRKLTTLDITSEEDNASDEDFKTSSFDDDEEDEDTSISVSSNSDSSLEIYRRRNKGGKRKQRKAARRAARERRKDRKFVVDESDEEELRPKSKKKRKEDDSDYTESETGEDDLSELSENLDSADLCDDTTSDESDGAWHPSKRKKQRKANVVVARKSPKLKKPQVKKPKRVEYSDDDISESEVEEDDEDDDDGAGGKGSGKQPRSQPLKSSNTGKGKGKGKTTATKSKKKKKPSEDEDSFSDSEDSTRRTRGRRYAYLEDFDDDSSDGGIKPGVKRPDTPPEEREKFIKRQEEIKRMLAEKNAEGAKLAATPRLTPIKATGAGADKDKRSPAKPGDSLSTVPLSVIRQAKVLDIDYLQRKGESVGDLDNVDEVDEFDDADLVDDFPEDMDEDTIARMVEEEEELGAAAAARELPAPDEVLRTAIKAKPKEADKPMLNPSLAALSQMPGASPSGLQEPMRKRLPMPTMHPPLLRHQFPTHMGGGGGGMHPAHMMHRHPGPPPTHLLQNALSAPLGQPLNRGGFPHHQHASVHPRMLTGLSAAQAHAIASQLMPSRQPLPASQPLPSAAPPSTQPDAIGGNGAGGAESESKPRGRRKKITPLRDPLQKQQAAAAVTAAAHADKTETTPTNNNGGTVISAPSSGVIKTSPSAAATLSIAQPPQLYKPLGVGVAGVETQPSVITRMPHLPPSSRPSLYHSPDAIPRFYGPPHQSGPPRQLPPHGQRHRGHPQISGLPPHPHSMRPTYGPPPPLRGPGPPPPSNHTQPPTSVAGTGVRSPYITTQGGGEHHGPPLLSAVYGTPPPARHSSTHLNPYRPPIYGNPNYAPRAPPNLRPGAPSGSEYPGGGPRAYPPYGYYPPPPLTTPAPPLAPSHSQITSASSAATTHSTTSAPSSVIVTAPSATLSAATVDANHHTPAARPPHSHPSTSSAAPLPTRTVTKSPSPSVAPTLVASAAAINSSKAIGVIESRKKLTTLEAYTATTTKSPLAIGGESSGSRSSPAGMQHPDAADDSSSTPAASTAAATTVGGEGQASEFSGLVSYFSSQHDDYNT